MSTLALATDFIARRWQLHHDAWQKKQATAPPLFVGIQGPQGCGKSYLAEALPEALAATSQHLQVATLSLDDMYLPHQELLKLAQAHPTNKLVHGRGQPGTHDLPLGRSCLTALKALNDSSSASERHSRQVQLPCYDKSRHGGRGDRSEETVTVEGPVDVVVFEGWMVGFSAREEAELDELYAAANADPEAYARANLDYPSPVFIEHQLEDLSFVNEELRAYESQLWSMLDCFVQLKPKEMSYVWEWRLQQEHNMKAKNGGQGMSDEEVRSFVARYMPGYELFLDGIQTSSAPWRGAGLQIVVGRDRGVLHTRDF